MNQPLLVRCAVAALLVAPSLSTFADAQGTVLRASQASVRGVVTDDDDKPVVRALISIPALERVAVTDDSGRFTMHDLPATEFVVQVRKVGYRPDVRRVALASGESRRIEVRLSFAAVTVSEVMITGTATASDQRGAQDVAALSNDHLRSAATGSVGKTLERVPGVANLSGGPAAGNPVLRGLSQGRVRMVRDGVPQESFEASPRWFPPGDLSSVDRIEVIRGPASILYGSNALGGAINIIPRALPSSDRGLAMAGLVQSQYFSNNGERYLHGEVAGGARGVAFRVGGARRVADNFRTPSVTTYAESKEQGAPLVAGRVNHSNYDQASAYAQGGIAGGWGHAQAVFNTWKGSNNFPNASLKPAGVQSTNVDWRLKGNVIAGSFLFKPNLVVQRVRILRAATAAKTFEAAADSGLWDQDLVNTIVTTRLEVTHPAVRGIRGTVGAEASTQSATTRLSQIQPSGWVENVAAFAFEEYQLSRLVLSAGVRMDLRHQVAESNPLVEAMPDARQAAALDRRFAVATGSVGASYRLAEPLTVVANLSTGFRAPSFLDLYTNEYRPALSGWVEGNPTVSPERSTSVEAGIRYSASRATWNLTGYRNTFTNFIYLQRSGRTRVVSGNSVPVFATEQTPAVLSGIEASANVELVENLVAEASYSKIVSRNESTGEQLALMPADQLRGSVRYTARTWRGLQMPYAQLGAKHAWAKQIAGPTEPFADGGSKGYGIASTPAYSLVDAGIGARIPFGGTELELHLSVDNLFDTAFRDFLDTQKGFTLGQGRNVMLRVSAPFALKR